MPRPAPSKRARLVWPCCFCDLDVDAPTWPKAKANMRMHLAACPAINKGQPKGTFLDDLLRGFFGVRAGTGAAAQPVVADPWAGIDRALLAEVLGAGRKEMARRCHPDAGGDGEKMARVNALVDEVSGRAARGTV